MTINDILTQVFNGTLTDTAAADLLAQIGKSEQPAAPAQPAKPAKKPAAEFYAERIAAIEATQPAKPEQPAKPAKKTVADLRAECKTLGIKGYSKLKKAELEAAIAERFMRAVAVEAAPVVEAVQPAPVAQPAPVVTTDYADADAYETWTDQELCDEVIARMALDREAVRSLVIVLLNGHDAAEVAPVAPAAPVAPVAPVATKATVVELKAKAKELGIRGFSSMKRDELLGKIREVESGSYSRDTLSSMSTKALKAICKQKGIKGYSTWSKPQIVSAILNPPVATPKQGKPVDPVVPAKGKARVMGAGEYSRNVAAAPHK